MEQSASDFAKQTICHLMMNLIFRNYYFNIIKQENEVRKLQYRYPKLKHILIMTHLRIFLFSFFTTNYCIFYLCL